MNRRKILAISSVIVILLVASFSVGILYPQYRTIGGESRPGVMTATADMSVHPEGLKDQSAPQERVVIYNAQVSLETEDIQGTLARIRGLADTLGGYVASSTRSTYGLQSRAEIAIRVPKDKFHATVQEIETYGKVIDESTTSEDITQQHIDLKARLNNLLKQEERLREILSAAKTVDEILRVEDELARTRGEIDSLQGQVSYLERTAEMSLISVLLTEPAPPFTPPGMDWGETLEIAILGFFTIVRGMIILTISLIPVAVIGVPAYYVYKRNKRRKQ